MMPFEYLFPGQIFRCRNRKFRCRSSIAKVLNRSLITLKIPTPSNRHTFPPPLPHLLKSEPHICKMFKMAKFVMKFGNALRNILPFFKIAPEIPAFFSFNSSFDVLIIASHDKSVMSSCTTQIVTFLSGNLSVNSTFPNFDCQHKIITAVKNNANCTLIWQCSQHQISIPNSKVRTRKTLHHSGCQKSYK